MSDVHILYNGACPICRAEIGHYRAKAVAAAAPLRFEDLNDADLVRWDLTADQATRRMHARLADGTIVSGVAAFALIWDALPGYRWLARLVRLPIARTVASFAYDRIAAPWLYRRHRRRTALEAARSPP